MRSHFRQSLLVIALVFQAGCAPIGVNRTADHTEGCAPSVSTDCLSLHAREALQELTDESGFVVGSSELVVALEQTNEALSQEVMQEALIRAKNISDPVEQANGLILLSSASANAAMNNFGLKLVPEALVAIRSIEDETKRWDAFGKLTVAVGRLGDTSKASAMAASMPQSSDYLSSLKARTYHDLAPEFARQQDFSLALQALKATTMGLVYYRAAARTDVATLAQMADKPELAANLLSESEDFVPDQTDGYFISGALRHIASSHATTGNDSEASRFFSKAIRAARSTEVIQKRARALSRIATAQSDFARYSDAKEVLNEALEIAAQETNPTLQRWCYYEIAGSAAFAGAFDLAEQVAALIPKDFQISGKPLYAATQRDIAWGLARHQHMDRALEKIASIDSLRERVQAYARVIRVNNNASMRALPRYL